MGKQKRTQRPKKDSNKFTITQEQQLEMMKDISRRLKGLPPKTKTHKDKSKEGGRRSRQDKFKGYND